MACNASHRPAGASALRKDLFGTGGVAPTCLDLGDPNTYQVSMLTRSSDEVSSSQISAALLVTEAQRSEKTCSGDRVSGEWGS